MKNAEQSFIKCARAFCCWVESGRHELGDARQHLLSLMQAVANLRVGSVPTSDIEDFPRRGGDDPFIDHKRFAGLPFQYYRIVLLPFELNDEEPAMGDLADDLADIYGDLWHGLQALDSEDKDYAIWYWRDSYSHWGHHAAAALYAIDEHLRANG